MEAIVLLSFEAWLLLFAPEVEGTDDMDATDDTEGAGDVTDLKFVLNILQLHFTTKLNFSSLA